MLALLSTHRLLVRCSCPTKRNLPLLTEQKGTHDVTSGTPLLHTERWAATTLQVVRATTQQVVMYSANHRDCRAHLYLHLASKLHDEPSHLVQRLLGGRCNVDLEGCWQWPGVSLRNILDRRLYNNDDRTMVSVYLTLQQRWFMQYNVVSSSHRLYAMKVKNTGLYAVYYYKEGKTN